jgi:hypothetical protein
VLVKYTYPVETSLSLHEVWPVSWGRYQLEFRTSAERVDAIVVTVRVLESDEWAPPKVTLKPTPGVAANIDVGSPPLHAEVDELLRTLQGLLGFFSHIEIDFARPTILWEPESDEERAAMQLHSIAKNTEKSDLMQPTELAYDLIVRCVLSTEATSHFEVPLSFLRKGNQDIYNERYIEAIYSLYFFLETLFAPGFSNPRQVKEKLKQALPIRDGLAHIRGTGWRGPGLIPTGFLELSLQSDEKIIDHLVDLRGDLHHHALPKKTGNWHPNKQDRFRGNALFLSLLVNKISMDEILPILYSTARSEDLMRVARENNAVTFLRVHPDAIDESGCKATLTPMRIELPSSRLTTESIRAADREFRRRAPGLYPGAKISEYQITSDNGEVVYTRYSRKL